MLVGLISRRSWSDFQVFATLGTPVLGVILKENKRVLYSNSELVVDLYFRISQNLVYLLKVENA